MWEYCRSSLTSRGQIHVLADSMKQQSLITEKTQTQLNQNTAFYLYANKIISFSFSNDISSMHVY